MEQNEPTTGEIVRDLRRCFNEKSFGCVDCACRISSVEHFCDYDKISDRLEAQEREIEELKAEAIVNALENAERIANLTARAEQAERERDAAIKDIEMVMIDNMCYGCISYKNGECSRCDNRCVPKWRGLPQEGEGV